MSANLNLEHFETYSSYIPVSLNLLNLHGFIVVNLTLSAFIIFRYFLMVSPFHFLRNVLVKSKLKHKQIRHEIRYSILSTVFFSLSGYLIALLWDLELTKIYLKFDEFGYTYLLVSFFIFAFFHEVYFYFTHLWMHQPKIFKKVHSVHHFSNPTSPWASFSFHPYECLIHAAFLPLMVIVIPIHPTVLIGYLTFMTLTAIFNHLGFEIFPFKAFNKHFISGTHHSLHHKHFKGNYGLYFCLIDRLLKTEIRPLSETVKPGPKRPQRNAMKPGPGRPQCDAMKPGPGRPQCDAMKPGPGRPQCDAMKPGPGRPQCDAMKPGPGRPQCDAMKPGPGRPQCDAMKPGPGRPQCDAMKPGPGRPQCDAMKPGPGRPLSEAAKS